MGRLSIMSVFVVAVVVALFNDVRALSEDKTDPAAVMKRSGGMGDLGNILEGILNNGGGTDDGTDAGSDDGSDGNKGDTDTGMDWWTKILEGMMGGDMKGNDMDCKKDKKGKPLSQEAMDKCMKKMKEDKMKKDQMKDMDCKKDKMGKPLSQEDMDKCMKMKSCQMDNMGKPMSAEDKKKCMEAMQMSGGNGE